LLVNRQDNGDVWAVRLVSSYKNAAATVVHRLICGWILIHLLIWKLDQCL